MEVTCPVCGERLIVIEPGPVECPTCRSTLEVVAEGPGGFKIPAWVPTLVSAVGGAVLGSIITGAWPWPDEPPEVRRDKISKLVASFTASAFVGMLAYELSKGAERT